MSRNTLKEVRERRQGSIFKSKHGAVVREPLRKVALPGRNAPCLCGSGRKFKHCCRTNAQWYVNAVATGQLAPYGIAALGEVPEPV